MWLSPWLLALLACMLLVPGVRSIGISFSAEDGGASLGISNDYQLSDGVSVNEGAEAKFGNVEMNDHRAIDGTGDMHLTQRMVGSGGYVGESVVNAAGSTGNIVNDANLLPSALSAQQTADMEGQAIFADFGLRNKNCESQTYSILNNGELDASQSINTGSALASQITYMNAVSGEATSRASTYTKNGYTDLAGTTQIWLDNGDMKTTQKASAELDQVYAAQNAYLSAFGGASQTFAENHCYESNYNHNFAGVANEGKGGINLQMDQQAEANEIESDANQQLIAETSNNPNPYAEGFSEASWILSPDRILRRGAWVRDQVTGPNSYLNYGGFAFTNSPTSITNFVASQIGNGEASGVAGYFWSKPSGNPHFPSMTPIPGQSISPWWPTNTNPLYLGVSQENSDGSVRLVQVI